MEVAIIYEPPDMDMDSLIMEMHNPQTNRPAAAPRYHLSVPTSPSKSGRCWGGACDIVLGVCLRSWRCSASAANTLRFKTSAVDFEVVSSSSRKLAAKGPPSQLPWRLDQVKRRKRLECLWRSPLLCFTSPLLSSDIMKTSSNNNWSSALGSVWKYNKTFTEY